MLNLKLMTQAPFFLRAQTWLFVFILLLAIGLGVLGYYYYTLDQTRITLEEKSAIQQSRIEELENTLIEVRSFLEEAMYENAELSENLEEEKGRNEEFQDQIDDIADTVGILDKLSKTDEELLQKYSKVYFLNEHFVPDSLAAIDKELLYDETTEKKIHSKVKPELEDMLEDALQDGIKIWVVSAYRSFSEQINLKGAYSTTYGSGANAFSADQGYSEHQLGTTLDFTTEGLNGGLVTSFETTLAFTWLTENAHKYGFTLSYPKGNAYYVYEPWHWRYVGVDLAKDLKRDNAYFYDWDQRKIDEYLISVFD